MMVSDDDLPSFSVIIPTCNRPGQLTHCLAALMKLDYPKDRFEIVVVDDGGETDLTPIVQRFLADLRIKLLKQANAGPAMARNTGAAAASHEFLAFTDDDCTPATDWLKRTAAILQASPDVLMGGGCTNALPDNAFASASHAIIDVIHSHFNHDHRNAVFFPSNNIAMSRRKYLECKGFDPLFRWAEDRDFCDRWRAYGGRLVFEPEARIEHAHKMGLRGFVKQHFGYGKGAWRFHRARKARQTGRLEVEGNFYLKCFVQPLKTHSIVKAIPIVALLGVWQVANTCGFFYEAIRSMGQPSADAGPESVGELR